MPSPSRKKCHSSPHAVLTETNSNVDRLVNTVAHPTKVAMTVAAVTEHVQDESNMKKQEGYDCNPSFLIDTFTVMCKHVQLRQHWVSAHGCSNEINKDYGFMMLDTQIDTATLNRVVLPNSLGFGNGKNNESNSKGEVPPAQNVWHFYVNKCSSHCNNPHPPSPWTNLQPEDNWDTKAAANLKQNPEIINLRCSNSEYKKLFCVKEDEDNRVNQECVYLMVLLCQVLKKYPNPVGMKWVDLFDETIKYLATIPSGVPPLKGLMVLQQQKKIGSRICVYDGQSSGSKDVDASNDESVGYWKANSWFMK
eukprot:scaffold115913_cov68-Attheya_sp.AAC.4